MNTTLTKQSQRLDQIFFLFYPATADFNLFLKANKGLLKQAILTGGQVVYLPDLTQARPTDSFKSPLLDA